MVARGGECLADHRVLVIAIGLVGAVLARVQHMEIRQPAVWAAAIKRHVRSLRKRSSAQRHEFIVCLVGVHAPGEKFLRCDAFLLRDEIGIVVVKLVIVPRHQPWEEPVSVRQHFVHPVLRVARAVLVKRFDLATEMFARAIVDTAIFINVIPQMHDEIEILLRHVRVAVKVTALVMLARGEGKPRAFGHRIGRRCRAGAADRAGFITSVKTIKIPVMWLESGHLHMHRVPQLWQCQRGALAHDVRERLIGGHLPTSANRLRGHAATLEWFWRKPRPQHHSIWLRIA